VATGAAARKTYGDPTFHYPSFAVILDGRFRPHRRDDISE